MPMLLKYHQWFGSPKHFYLLSFLFYLFFFFFCIPSKIILYCLDSGGRDIVLYNGRNVEFLEFGNTNAQKLNTHLAIIYIVQALDLLLFTLESYFYALACSKFMCCWSKIKGFQRVCCCYAIPWKIEYYSCPQLLASSRRDVIRNNSVIFVF